jgi:hypothetical protein
MSAFPDDEGSFLRFAQAHDPALTGGSFAPRHLYGKYLEQVLHDAARDAAPGTVLEHVVGDATSIVLAADGAGATVSFGGGPAVVADRVILAVGNYAPADPRVADTSFFGSPRYLRDPWVRGALGVIGARDPVLLVGTGLTTIDIALDLWNRGLRAPMHAVSRRGSCPGRTACPVRRRRLRTRHRTSRPGRRRSGTTWPACAAISTTWPNKVRTGARSSARCGPSRPRSGDGSTPPSGLASCATCDRTGRSSGTAPRPRRPRPLPTWWRPARWRCTRAA